MELQQTDPFFDSYQIQQTPYFKRLHRHDTLGQIKRLKDAYESIRSFDERPLKTQIKKKRLEKLNHQIKSSISTMQKQIAKPKNKKERRWEELTKARQLGIQYSRQNTNCNFHSNLKLIKKKSNNIPEDLESRKSQLSRRLDYGNKQTKLLRSKIRTQEPLRKSREFYSFSSKTNTKENKEKLRNSLMHYLFEEKPNKSILNLFEEIVHTKNHLYWDLMGTVASFNKKLSKFDLRNFEFQIYREVFNSKSNIKACGSEEVLLKTYRYSDDDQFLPPPSESLLKLTVDSNESVRDDLPSMEECENIIDDDLNIINHFKYKLSSATQTNTDEQKSPRPGKKKYDLLQKVGGSNRQAVSKGSTITLTNLEKAIKH